MANTNTRQTNRKPVTLKIKFKSGTLDEFIERYAVDISQGGIFIRTKDPLPVGTTLKFAFLLKDATPLIAGEGTVVWNRAHDPARTGISPGMGVRFDKLSSDSQGTLDEVLARKSGSSTNPNSESNAAMPLPNDDFDDDDDDPAGDFVDSPTRVAPAGLVESLRATDFEDDDKTPLPKPMPFHGDDSDFDESAFSESTRVVGVDELLASAGNPDALATPAPPLTPEPPLTSETERANTEVADDYEDPFGDLNEDSDSSTTPSLDLHSDFESSTPAVPLQAPKEPEPATEETAVEKESDTPTPARAAPASEEAKSKAPASVPSIAAKEAPSDDGGGSSMGWIAVAAVILLIGGVGGFWFLNKDKKKEAKGTNEKPQPQQVTTLGADAAPKTTQPVVSLDAAVPSKTQSVTINVVPEGANVAVEGTSLAMPSPATFDLEEGKSFTLTINHSEFAPQSVEIVVDGSEIPTVELAPKPKLLRLTSVPPGASVILNGIRIKDKTPVEITLDPKQLRRPRMRLQMRLTKYKPLMESFSMIEKEWEAGGDSLVKEFEFALVAIPVRQPRTPRIVPPTNNDPTKDDPTKDDPTKDDPTKDPIKDTTPKENPTADDPDTTSPDENKPPATKPDKDETKAPKDNTPPAGGEPTPDWMQ